MKRPSGRGKRGKPQNRGGQGGSTPPKKQRHQRRRKASGGDQDGGGRNRAARKARQAQESSRPQHRGQSPSGGGGGSRSDSGGGGFRSPSKFVGRIQKSQRGFAFVLPDDSSMPDAYVSAEEAAGLLTDDRVEFAVRRRGDRLSAEIIRVISRGQTEVMGQLKPSRKHGMYLETLSGEAYGVSSEGLGGAGPGEWVIATIEQYPAPDRGGRVAVKEKLGHELTPAQDRSIAISRFGLDEKFSERALADAEKGREYAQALLEEVRQNRSDRVDLRNHPLVTIDGADAKDFDDAVLVECPKGGHPAFILYVAIADVSYFVRPETDLDEEACDRGTSVYFPGTVIPMLPESLSNDLCSLRPRLERLALTAEIHYDSHANVTSSKFYEAVIQTARRLTYDQVHLYNEGDPKTREDLVDLEKPIANMAALYQKLTRKRKERGVLDFDLPECKIQVDKQGRPTHVGPAARVESHKWVEEFMIAANQAVAKALREDGVAAVYRVHEAPDPGGVEELNQLLKSHGVTQRIEDITPHAFAHILEATINLPGAATLHQAILRRQKQAKYEPNPKGHFGLALKDYTHFTSPIRRYPDLVVHRALKRLIRSRKGSDKGFEDLSNLDEVAAQNSDSERKAMEAERWVVKRKQCWFMLDRVGQTFPGKIVGVTARGLFVEIPQFALDGFVSLERLSGHFEYDERRHCLRRRPGHGVLAVGDPMSIRVANVSMPDNQIEFEPLEAKAPGAPEESKRP